MFVHCTVCIFLVAYLCRADRCLARELLSSSRACASAVQGAVQGAEGAEGAVVQRVHRGAAPAPRSSCGCPSARLQQEHPRPCHSRTEGLFFNLGAFGSSYVSFFLFIFFVYIFCFLVWVFFTNPEHFQQSTGRDSGRHRCGSTVDKYYAFSNATYDRQVLMLTMLTACEYANRVVEGMF